MNIAYFLVAEGANQSADGKLNVLGAGIRVINAPTLPWVQSLAVLISVEFTLEELGKHLVRLTIDGPSQGETLVETSVELGPPDNLETRLPLHLDTNFTLGGYPFREPGVHVIRATIGPVVGEYSIVVNHEPSKATAAG